MRPYFIQNIPSTIIKKKKTLNLPIIKLIIFKEDMIIKQELGTPF